MKITFTNTSSTNAVNVGRYTIPAAGSLQVDFSSSSSAPPNDRDLAALHAALTANQIAANTDVVIPQGLGGSGQYVPGTTYSTAPLTLANVLNVVGAVQQQTAFSATPTFDFSQGTTVILAPVTANITSMTVTNPPHVGSRVVFVIPTSGAFTITWPASFKKAADGAAAASKKGVTEFIYDGTNYVQVGGALAFN